MLQYEIREFSSRHEDGTPMFPGKWGCTFAKFGGVWVMISMKKLEPV